MNRLAPVLILALVFVGILALCWWGWRRRAARQERSGLAAPWTPGTEQAVAADAAALPGIYVATTAAGSPLERITAHGLGARSRARVIVDDESAGRTWWTIAREGAEDLHIPVADIAEVTTAAGMVGKWMGGEALVVIRWRLGADLVDTGLRMDTPADHDRLLARGRALPEPTTTPAAKETR